MTATLKLKDNSETVDFLDGTNYQLEDDSFRMSPPERVETRAQDNFYAGRDLLRMEYGPRSVTFDIFIYGSTQLALSNNISKIQRLLTRASSLPYLQGGDYNQTVTFTEGSQTGDQGVILQMRRGGDTLPNIISEFTNSSVAQSGLYTMRVIAGDLEITQNIFGSADKTGKASNKFFRRASVTLQVEPFILGPSRVVATVAAPGLRNEPYYNTGHTNRIIIQAESVPGDVEALTRIGTNLSGNGIIIGRDAGISLLNCPSYPTLDMGVDDMFVYGQIDNTANLSYKININGTGTPNTFRFSVNDGTNWGPTTNIVAWNPIQLQGHTGLINAYAIFGSTTGFTMNQTWSFSNHQAYFRNTAAAIDTYAQRNTLMSDQGLSIHDFYVNIPPGCRSRYKLVGQISSDILAEYRMRVNFIGRGPGLTRVGTEPQYFEWSGPFESRMVDFGIIDLTSLSVPFMSHPYAPSVIRINIYARSVEDITTDTSDTIKFERGYLIPVQDEFAYMQAAWKTGGTGVEVYSNYDASNPYIAEEGVNLFNGASLAGRFSVGLDATYGGNVITLIPNIKQTLIMVPLISVSTDWRDATIGTGGSTGNTYIAIRPRYLHLPG